MYQQSDLLLGPKKIADLHDSGEGTSIIWGFPEISFRKLNTDKPHHVSGDEGSLKCVTALDKPLLIQEQKTEPTTHTQFKHNLIPANY